jgi:hypothetical protein
MTGRWLRACAWAGLTETSDLDPVLQPVPWKMAARAWVLVYLGSTFIMTSTFLTTEALMGEGIHWSTQVLAPIAGGAVFMGAIGGGRRAARSAPAAGRQRIQTGTWAAIIAWVALFGMATIADRLVHEAAGVARFGMSVAMTTLACAVFVAVTHVRSHPARSQ